MTNFKVDAALDVLIWARKSIGLSLDDAAKRIRVGRLELELWEEGAEEPSIAQLRRMSEAYRCPLAVLLLPEPPREVDSLPDFRLMPQNDNKPWSPALHQAFRRVQMQREVARELSEVADEVPSPIDLEVNLSDDTEVAGTTIRAWLGIRSGKDSFAPYRGDLNQWIELVEARSILVTQIARVALEEMRGCSISEHPFPAIILNGADAPRGKIFTLLHELVHILLHAGGLCDLEETRTVKSDKERIERFCNRVAAAILMPRAQLLHDHQVASVPSTTRWSDEDLGRLANLYGASKEAMLLRLVSLGRASWDYYLDRRSYFQKTYQEMRQERKGKGRGPSYSRVKLRDLGRRYVLTVLDAYHRREITGSEMSDYLDMKLNHVAKLESLLEAQ